MTRAIVSFAVLSLLALPSCEKKDTVNPADEASNAPAEEEDFSPEEEYEQQGTEEEEAAPGLSARSNCRAC